MQRTSHTPPTLPSGVTFVTTEINLRLVERDAPGARSSKYGNAAGRVVPPYENNSGKSEIDFRAFVTEIY